MTHALSIQLRWGLHLTLCWLALAPVNAAIVEMPVIEEPPSLHGESVFENYNIPSTVNRSLESTDGPRLWVKEIHIQGLENFPKLNIRREEIIAYIEKRRYEIMREDEIKEHGFTEKEVAEIIELLNELDVSINYEHVSTPELQRFIWLVRQQKERRGLTLSQIERLATDVENYYHDRGLKLAKAYLPRQAMREGVLVIEVMNGKLGAVEIENNTLYSTDAIIRPFHDILTHPVTFDQIEERMFLINDYPGINITGLFKPGYQIGDTELHLTLQDESRFDSTLRLDNHGSELTGETRGFAQFYWNNPTGIADQFNLAILQSTSPDNTTYGQIGYRLPLFDPRLHFSISTSTNQFILDQSQDASGSVKQLGITGKTKQAGLDIDYVFKRSRAASWWGHLIYDTTETILDSDEFGNLGLDDKIKNLRLSAQFDVLNNESKILHLGSATLTSGEFDFGAGDGRDEQYSKLNANYTLMTFVPLSRFDTVTRLLIKSELQYSNNPLPSAEQYALASPTRVRAYPVNQFSADKSLYIGVEWVFNTPGLLKFDRFSKRNIHQKVQPVLFINTAKGIQNTLTGADDIEGTLIDAGFGFQFGFGKSINGNLQFAFPIKDEFSIDSITVPDDSVKVVFDFQYRI
ncbi:MAG: ShlB/FhaC/HecB family hemolysin secretion/activation protein [Gammaproteobacteria bacterium]|nr:ShlB/FhaC/HecB family hemolysin secretion/activation protein [Gammaproteobacteria bacterium]